MTSMGVRATLAVLLLFIATVKAGEGDVTFWREDFTMTCPESGIWYNNEKNNITDGEKKTLTYKYGNERKGRYYCEYEHEDEKKKYFFYVQGKACYNCFEVEPVLLMVVIIADLFVTTSVMLTIWRCTKKKGSAGPAHTSKAPARSGGRAPPVPSPDYEQLNTRTLSQDTYSTVNRTG